jgi:creatinine amidohydrolase
LEFRKRGAMLEEITWKCAREVFSKTKVALIPVGSTEQHGPHLPLGTDFLTARDLAQAGAAATGAICTPVIPVGISEHHRQFWGTLWIEPKYFRGYMHGVAVSLAYHGIRRIIFVNGHGGNDASLQEVCRHLHREGIYAIVWKWGSAVAKLDAELLGGTRSKAAHSGERETSMMLRIAEHLVHKTAFDEAAAGASPHWGVQLHGATTSFDGAEFSRSGATGDPRRATKDIGDRFYQTAVESLVSLIRWLEKLPDGQLQPRDHIP